MPAKAETLHRDMARSEEERRRGAPRTKQATHRNTRAHYDVVVFLRGVRSYGATSLAHPGRTDTERCRARLPHAAKLSYPSCIEVIKIVPTSAPEKCVKTHHGNCRKSPNVMPHRVLTPQELAGQARTPPARAQAPRRMRQGVRPRRESARPTTSRGGACPRARARRRRARARRDRTTRR